VTFDLAGGTVNGSPDPIRHTLNHGTQIGLHRVPQPVRVGFILRGWRHSDNWISTSEEIGAIVLNTTGTVTAVWEAAVTRVTINNPVHAPVDIGFSRILTATASPANAVDRRISWHATRTATASINANGQVVAHDVGMSLITAYSTPNAFVQDWFHLNVIRPDADSEIHRVMVGFHVPANHPTGSWNAAAITGPLFFRRGDELRFWGEPKITGGGNTGWIELGIQLRDRFGNTVATHPPIRLNIVDEVFKTMAFDMPLPPDREAGNYFLYFYRRGGTAGVAGYGTIHIVAGRP